MANYVGVVYNGNPKAMLKDIIDQLPDGYVFSGEPEAERFVNLLKKGDTAYALVQISSGEVEGHKMRFMGALQDRLIFTEKKGTKNIIIPYSEINHVEISCGWLACGISIYKNNGNRINFDSVLKVASKHFDSWFSSYNSRNVNGTHRAFSLSSEFQSKPSNRHGGFWEKEDKMSANKIQDEGGVKVDQTAVQDDYVDDRDANSVKDGVINRSNGGPGGEDKLTKIKELKELYDSGALDDDEFKQMKKEILGK